MFRNYENKFGKRQYGTWEWLFGEDYNYNNNVDDTVEAMEKIANAREDLYKFTDDNDTIYTYKLPYDSNATEEIENRKLKYGERISRYCEITSGNNGFHTLIKVKQTPAAFTMILADLTASFYHEKEEYPYCDFMFLYNPDHTDEEKLNIRVPIYAVFGIPIGESLYQCIEPELDIGFYVAYAYQDSKDKFVSSGIDTSPLGVFNLGGMVHGHMPGTYYFLANDYYYELEKQV